MPIYKLQCIKCNQKKSIIHNGLYDTIPLEKKSCECGNVMKRNTKGPSTSIMEKLDNGSMVRALERYSDAEQIFKERHENADPLAGTEANKS